MSDDKTLSTSLAVMRFSLAAFLLVWVFQKILVPQGAAGVFKGFYGATLGETIVMGQRRLALEERQRNQLPELRGLCRPA